MRKEMNRILALAVIAVATVALPGCGGTTSHSQSTATNPAPGVTLQAIQITPATALIGIAENRQLRATGVYSDGGSVDITSQVTWSASSAPSTTNYVTVSPGGVATGMAIGSAVVSATVGPVIGLLQLTVDTNGYASSTTAVLSVPYKSTVIDAAYVPQSQTKIQGAYAVQEVNLDADQFSNVLPVGVALLASVPMPPGFVPNAAVGSQSSFLVAVISYSSPEVQIIDASNVPSDLNNNTVIAAFTAPVSQTVTINGITCMICAAVVNPVDNNLLLSTAQGFYTMDLVSGTFTAIPFTPAPAPSASFSVNPLAANPYILSASPSTGEVQILNLTTNAVSTVNLGLTAPGTVALDLLTNYAAAVDAGVNNQSVVDFTNPLIPQFTVEPELGICPGQPDLMNMAAMGVSANSVLSNVRHTLLISQTSGNCAGFQPWPLQGQLSLSPIYYGYAPMPVTPDGNAFVNGNDPNAITTFNDVYPGNAGNYGLLVDANQQWIARINLLSVSNAVGVGEPSDVPLPSGSPIPATSLCPGGPNAIPGCLGTVVYLPSPSTAVTLSVSSLNFGSAVVGTSSAELPVTLADIGVLELNDQISIRGTNAGDFSLLSNCAITLEPRSSCTIDVIFTPSAQGARSAILSVTTTGTGASAQTQTVALSGTGTT